jgi:hypothetical protein
MPGIPTKLVVADKVLKALGAAGGPQADLLKSADNLPFFYLGALGAALGDLIAARPEVGAAKPNTPYFQVWLPVLSMFAGTAAQGATAATGGVYKDLKQLRDTVNKLNEIVQKGFKGNAAQKDIQKIALIGMKDELEALPAAISDLQKVVGTLTTLRSSIGNTIFTGGPIPKSPPSTSWQVRDTLHGSHTGRFLRSLNKLATDEQQKAYALGAIVGYATDLCGNPFVNSVVGAPYRNQWWRHRWISNYIDTWVYGFYGLGGANKVLIQRSGVPNPLYTNWPNVCEASLHKRIELPGLSVDVLLDAFRANPKQPVPSVLPQPFVDFWKKAYEAAYGPPDPGSGIDNAGLQSAYAMVWLILWIQTSGEAIPCIPTDRIIYPNDCGTRPDWVAVDGSVTTGNGTVASPPTPKRDTDPSVAEIVSGIVMAILAVAAWVGTALVAAVEFLAAAVVLIADGVTDPDWDKLRCSVAWTLAFQSDLTNQLRELLTWAGLGFPYTKDLTHNDIAFVNAGMVTPTDAALNTVQSKGRSNIEPASRWNPNPVKPASNWANPPSEPPEPPNEAAYGTPPTWPFHFVDGLQPVPPPSGSPTGSPPGVPQQVNPQGSPPLVSDAVRFKTLQGLLNVPLINATVFFGNAVDVSMELILKTKPADFLDWDLDGDPGIAFPTWRLPTPTSPRSSSIPEP